MSRLELEQGETLNRLGNVATLGGSFVLEEKTPNQLLREVAEEVADDDVDKLHDKILKDIDELDDELRYYSMRVEEVAGDEVWIHDWKTETTVSVRTEVLHLGISEPPNSEHDKRSNSID